MANKVIITKSKLNALGANMRQTHGLDHNPTIDEMAALALVPTGGSGGGIEIPTVSNIAVDTEGVLTFDAPVIEGLTDYELEYIINVNGSETKTTETTINVKGSLVNGENTISIICVLTFNDVEEIVTIEFEKEVVITVLVAASKLPFTIFSASAASVGDYIYIFGGNGSSFKKTILRYSTITNTTPTQMSATLFWDLGATNGIAIGTKIYVIGGANWTQRSDVIHCYDTESDTISAMTTRLPNEMEQMASVLIDEKIYIFGGYRGGAYYNTIYCYDPQTDTITIMSAKLPNYMAYISAAAIDGKAYIFGGADSKNLYNTILCYDPVANTVTTKGGTLTGLMSHTSAVELDGKAYIIGGYDSKTSPNIYYNTIQCYDHVADICTTIEPKLSVGLYGVATAVANGWIYCFGGIGDYNIINIADLIHIIKFE